MIVKYGRLVVAVVGEMDCLFFLSNSIPSNDDDDDDDDVLVLRVRLLDQLEVLAA